MSLHGMVAAATSLLLVIAATAATSLLVVLGALVGLGFGSLFVMMVRRTSPEKQKEREIQIARETARRTFDETLRGLFGNDAVRR